MTTSRPRFRRKLSCWLPGILARGSLLLLLLAVAAAASEQDTARSLLAKSGVSGGLIVHLGCGNGRLTASLRANDRFIVHGLDADVSVARKYIQSLGLYGTVSVAPWKHGRLPYADNLVNLVVAEKPGEVPMSEVLRVLAPNGIAMLARKGAGESGDDPNRLVNSLRIDPRVALAERVQANGAWLKIRKKRPAGMAEWTHFRYGPEGNAVSPDTLVGVPNSLRWISDSRDWPKEHFDHLFGAVSAGGRLFSIFDESAAGFQLPRQIYLTARDAYNGILLWKRPVPAQLVSKAWRHGNKSDAWMVDDLVAVGGHVFVADAGRALELDASSGEIARVYKGVQPAQMAVVQGNLFLTGSNRQTPLQCLDTSTGENRWKYTNHVEHFICGAGRVFFVDRGGETVCLDAVTGRTLWRMNYGGVGDALKRLKFRRVVSCNGEILIASGLARSSVLQGISARDGRHLWLFEFNEPYHNFNFSLKNAFILDGLVWVNQKNSSGIPNDNSWVGLDLLTGKIQQDVPYGPAIQRCRPAQATESFFFCGSFDVCDRKTGEFHRQRAARNSCGFGVLPANGLVYSFPQSCECDQFLRGYLAFASSEAGRQRDAEPAPNQPPLVEGPAFAWAARARSGFDAKSADSAAADAWPCYRHDARRSGATQVAVPTDLRELWTVRIKGADSREDSLRSNAQSGTDPISAPVAAAGMVMVAVPERHQIVALDAATGAERWRFTAGGRIDSPPTIDHGWCLFGCRDGWIYTLRAKDGALVWRYRAAPEERLIAVDGQLESSWPISGSVLVENGVLYAAAGRHTDLDDGLVVCALNPADGKVIWKTRKARNAQKSFDHGYTIRTEWIEKGTGPWWVNGKPQDFSYRVSFREPAARGGLLASDGSSVYLGSWSFGPARKTPHDPDPNFVQTKNGFFDHSWNFRNWWVDCRIGGHLLSFNRERTFAIRMKGFAHRWEYKDNLHKPGTPFELVAQSKATPKSFFTLKSTKSAMKDTAADWITEIPVAGKAMTLTAKAVFVAGAPDGRDSRDGLLLAYSPDTGELLAKYKLAAPPVFDGMIAAKGRLYLATADGGVVCYAK